MSRIALAFRSFFAILFGGDLPADIAAAFGYKKPEKEAPKKESLKEVKAISPPSDGALQLLGILQRDARLIDFLMEDISGYPDDQVGAAVRPLQEESRAALRRYVTLAPVIDGVEGSVTKASVAGGASAVKFVGNVPSGPPPKEGMLRHKGWRAEKIDLPAIGGKTDVRIIAPAELEIE